MHRTASETSALPYIVAGTVAVLLLGLLTAQLLPLRAQYTAARKQLLVDDLRAFLEAARPLNREAPSALRATRQVAEQTLETRLVPRLARATARVDNLLARSRQAVAIGRT